MMRRIRMKRAWRAREMRWARFRIVVLRAASCLAAFWRESQRVVGGLV